MYTEQQMKYRKKPVVIEAIQLLPSSILQVYEFIYGKVDTNSPQFRDKWDDYEAIIRREGLRLKTPESDGETQVASMGDWVIKGVKGEFYPCKPDIFELTYETPSTELPPLNSEELMRLLESLTPGGSEYVNDPQACVEFVRQERQSVVPFIKKLNARIKELEAIITPEASGADGNK